MQDVSESADRPHVFVNPEILASELPGVVEEGCLQHEMDHLQGKLFVDRLSFSKRRSAIKRLMASRLQREGERREIASG